MAAPNATGHAAGLLASGATFLRIERGDDICLCALSNYDWFHSILHIEHDCDVYWDYFQVPL